MKKIALLIALAWFGPASAAPPQGFEQRADEVRRAHGVPGMAITIVEDGKVTMAKGFGVRKLGAPAKVDADTIFMTGSTGKAFTSAALATLVDAGKLKWDDRVSEKLPGFQMYDPWVTREMTVRDLLVHRSGLGLGSGDLLFVPTTNRSRAEIVAAMRHLKPTTSFRSGYAYDNVLYIVAGALVEAVSGETWEDYIRTKLFLPAGMTNSTADERRKLATVNRAYPHARLGQAVRGAGDQRAIPESDQLPQVSAPAGLLAISANDMAKWLRLQLDRGALPGGKRLFSEASAKEMWTPQVIEPITPLPGDLVSATPNFQLYALGWEVRDYAGAKIVWHSGGVFGYVTSVVLIPEKNVGFMVVINSEDSHVRLGLMYDLLDHYLGRPAQDWTARFSAFRQQRIDGALKAIAATRSTASGVRPSLPLGSYAGRYRDAMYGDVVVAPAGDVLTLDFTRTPGMKGRLEPFQYNSFIVRFVNPNIEPAYVNFGIDGDGKVSGITMKPVSPVADFSFNYGELSFTPVPGAQP